MEEPALSRVSEPSSVGSGNSLERTSACCPPPSLPEDHAERGRGSCIVMLVNDLLTQRLCVMRRTLAAETAELPQAGPACAKSTTLDPTAS